jgi:hypothetical protein
MPAASAALRFERSTEQYTMERLSCGQRHRDDDAIETFDEHKRLKNTTI